MLTQMSGAKRPLIVGVGEVLWDLLPAGRQFGGAPANFAYHAASLGGAAQLVSAVGDDRPGREILARLDELGIQRQQVAVDRRHPTGIVSVELDGQGQPRYTIHENAAWDFIPATPDVLDLARQAEAICFGTLAQRGEVSRATIRALLGAAPAACLRVFDINLRQHYYNAEVIAAGLRAADVLKLNDEELPLLAGLLALPGDEASQLRGLLAGYNLRLIALTKGASGAVLLDARRRSVHPGLPTAVADTVGAGDAFTAAVTMGLLEGLDLDAINERANRLASYVCSQPGATPPMPSLP